MESLTTKTPVNAWKVRFTLIFRSPYLKAMQKSLPKSAIVVILMLINKRNLLLLRNIKAWFIFSVNDLIPLKSYQSFFICRFSDCFRPSPSWFKFISSKTVTELLYRSLLRCTVTLLRCTVTLLPFLSPGPAQAGNLTRFPPKLPLPY